MGTRSHVQFDDGVSRVQVRVSHDGRPERMIPEIQESLKISKSRCTAGEFAANYVYYKKCDAFESQMEYINDRTHSQEERKELVKNYGNSHKSLTAASLALHDASIVDATDEPEKDIEFFYKVDLAEKTITEARTEKTVSFDVKDETVTNAA